MKRIIDDYEFEGNVTSLIKAKFAEKFPMMKVSFVDMDHYPKNEDFMFDTYVATRGQYNLNISKQNIIRIISQSTADSIFKELIMKIRDNSEVRKGRAIDKINMFVVNSKLVGSEDLSVQSASFFIDVEFELK